jgi:GT2 family glycosyltransferase
MLEALQGLGPKAGLIGNIQLNASTGEVDHSGISINLKGKPEHDRSRPGRLSLMFYPVRRVVAVTGACIVVSAGTWRRLGGFDEGFVNGCEDVDICLRAHDIGLTNAVALRSRVQHHVSASPGRKRRDEENTRRLFIRWRQLLAFLGSRDWTWDHFGRLVQDPRDFPDPIEAWKMALFMTRVTILPPRTAIEGMNRAIDAELARWQVMFSH